MKNREIAQTFEQIADMLSIRGDSIHRVLAYRRAAENIRELSRDLAQIRAEGELTRLPGIGATLAEKIDEMLTTGELTFYKRLAEEVPPTLVEMLRVEGLGPKRVKQFHDQLKVTTLAELARAAQEGKLRDMPGLGAKSEAKIRRSIEALARRGDERTPLAVAWPVAGELLATLRELPGVQQAAAAGSLRRMRETIGDLDLLVAADDSEPIMAHFRNMDMVEQVLGSGPTKTSVVLHNGLQVDLRVLPAERWGTLLSYFTGSKDHNVRLRELALKHGLSLNEHAFTRQDDGLEILCASEEEIYETLGLPYVVPPLREDRGEIEAALAGTLPALVKLNDIQGDLHMHTRWSDGQLTTEEMAEAAREHGYRYMAITDHSIGLGIANGLSVERLRMQAAEIRSLAAELAPDIKILHGVELEIRADGSLDYPDEVLAELDLVIASLHTSLGQDRDTITKRLLGAIDNPHVDIIAHPTGRLMPDREGADLDMETLLQAAARNGTIMEVNANPYRLDLRDSHVRRALELGVLLSINTDAHNSDQLKFMRFGVGTAQRGWATADRVVNTWPMQKLLAHLEGSSRAG
jgi:DNA polymerase (family X)